jgi:hypothetical protein
MTSQAVALAALAAYIYNPVEAAGFLFSILITDL